MVVWMTLLVYYPSRDQTATALGLFNQMSRFGETLEMGDGHAARAE